MDVLDRSIVASLDRVDVFGSKQIDRATLIARWGEELAQIIRGAEVDRDSVTALEQKLRAEPGIAYAKISVITYFKPRNTFVTVDLVDEVDRAKRMTFAPQPTGKHEDPGGLVAMWSAYEEKALTLLAEGKMSPAAGDCPFWHCISFGHESLLPYKEAFATRVPAVEDKLAEILRDDADDRARGAAAYLLAHIASGQRVVELMVSAIRDPSEYARNSVMRVLAMIAQHHPEIPIPLAPVLAALRFPSTTDRNKASAILDGIAKHADAETKRQIDAQVGDVLEQMAAMKQPNNVEYAKSILANVRSGDPLDADRRKHR
jgi:hypothetical protein